MKEIKLDYKLTPDLHTQHEKRVWWRAAVDGVQREMEDAEIEEWPPNIRYVRRFQKAAREVRDAERQRYELAPACRELAQHAADEGNVELWATMLIEAERLETTPSVLIGDYAALDLDELRRLLVRVGGDALVRNGVITAIEIDGRQIGTPLDETELMRLLEEEGKDEEFSFGE